LDWNLVDWMELMRVDLTVAQMDMLADWLVGWMDLKRVGWKVELMER
jgi:hypothetical protein